MEITVDTNVLLRLFLDDDEAQTDAAIAAMNSAELVAISVHSLCELVWVFNARKTMPRREIAAAIRSLTGRRNVIINRPAVEAGLAVLDAGGDFADGVIAFDGQWMGARTFVSFDKKAVALLNRQGVEARLL
ncbi:MAG: type II toxin-antitoxin system VapC family toxin [Azonexus sp.]|jgi:predicted nucleic-acid-binding protein|nr:type II toxin-antitoxin system VapC family toxin [Azonexus sp.]